MGRENDNDWYEACNPLHGSRGLVPVKYFDTVGKTAGHSRSSTLSTSSAPHDSGYASNAPQISGPIMGHRSSKSFGKGGFGNGAMVYGIVAYDFHAERPDELEAKEGEAIIVIAQSNPEWFVAKPITRLGGPGLIPVSFIEIKDMQTGQPVTDTAAAIQKAGIPRVEEWKKMAADYKNTSIPLGQFGSPRHTPQGSISGIQQGMERMSVDTQQAAQTQQTTQAQQTNGYGHSRAPSNYSYAHPQQQQQQSIPPSRASVPRFLYADNKFHFIIECTLANGSHWDLSRIYEDFYELQINLIKMFPDEAGQTGRERTLPYMPGPVQFVTDKISEGRRENLDEYLHHLLQLGQHITKSVLVCGFFTPRPGDYEVDANEADLSQHAISAAAANQNRYSQMSQRSQRSQRSQQHLTPTMGQGGQPAQHHRQLSSTTGSYANHQRSQQSIGSSGSQRHHPSEYSPQPAVHPGPPQRQITGASVISTSANTNTALKVKVWFDRETCVVVRMPPKGQFRYSDLYHKISERRKLEYSGKKDSGVEEGDVDGAGNALNGGMVKEASDSNLEIEYRDERDGEYYRLADDEELTQALESCDKLTLVVREVD